MGQAVQETPGILRPGRQPDHANLRAEGGPDGAAQAGEAEGKLVGDLYQGDRRPWAVQRQRVAVLTADVPRYDADFAISW